MKFEIVAEGYVDALRAPAISTMRVGEDMKRMTNTWLAGTGFKETLWAIRQNERRLGHLYMDALVGELLDLEEGQYEAAQAGAWANVLRKRVEGKELLPSPTMEPFYWLRNSDGDYVALPAFLIDSLQTIADNGWDFFVRDLGNE